MCLCSCTPCEGIHAQVTSQRGSGASGKPGVLHTGEGDRSLSGILRTGEDTRKRILPGLDPWIVQWLASLPTTFEPGEGEDDYLLHGSESYATNHRHLQELHRLSAFQQVTTKVPPIL